MALVKRDRLSEALTLEFRAEAFNFRNHPNFGVPVGSPDNPLFGRTSTTATDPRDIQFGLKLIW
jgi:hypothetical protein